MSKSMSIGKTIKKLRRERDITQEQLAAYLGITSRAVSQWECDRTAPDITQLPLLSAIFDTTTDAILGVDLQRNEERIERLVEEAAAFSRSGDFAAATRLLEDGLKQYPRSYRIMAELAEALSCADLDAYAHTVGAAADIDSVSHRVRALCDTVIDECTEETVRDRAFQTIIYRCKTAGSRSLPPRTRTGCRTCGPPGRICSSASMSSRRTPRFCIGMRHSAPTALPSALPSSPRRTGSVQTRRIGFCTRLRISSTPCTASRIPTIMRIISCRRTRHWPKTTPLPAIRKTHFCVWKKCVKPGFCLTPTRRKRRRPRPQCAANAAAGLSRGRKTPAQDFWNVCPANRGTISSARSNRLPPSCAGWKRIPTPENPKERKRAALCFSGPLLLHRKGLQIKKQAFALWIRSVQNKAL